MSLFILPATGALPELRHASSYPEEPYLIGQDQCPDPLVSCLQHSEEFYEQIEECGTCHFLGKSLFGKLQHIGSLHVFLHILADAVEALYDLGRIDVVAVSAFEKFVPSVGKGSYRQGGLAPSSIGDVASCADLTVGSGEEMDHPSSV